MEPTRWPPPSGLHSGVPDDDGRHHGGASHRAAMPSILVQRCPALSCGDAPHPMLRTASVRPLLAVLLRRAGPREHPLDQLCYTPLSSSATATFPLTSPVSADIRPRSRGCVIKEPARPWRAPGAARRRGWSAPRWRGAVDRTAPSPLSGAPTQWSGAPDARRPVRGAHRGPGRDQRTPSGAGRRRRFHRALPGCGRAGRS